ncbi:MAG: glycosyltransferase [Propionibacteriaceae bacterium]|jgi:glycosyltransferase involved in cell wall biosynthesis|nr:glycosyltransferase [Propionibacteriaceae bacterium]
MPRVSVIVPVYNVEEYLALCIDSIRKQSFTDIEIICVNDGSSDSSRDILAMAAKVEPRLRIIDKPNGGLSSARNVGIDAAQGDIVMFVDSDDWLDRRACKTVVEVFDKEHPDMATFGARIFPRSAVEPWLRSVLTPTPEVFEGQHIELPFVRGSSPFVWRTAVSRDFLLANDLLFDEDISFGEDQVFHFQAYPLSSKTVLSKKRIYYYRASRPGSLMSNHNEDLAKKLLEHQKIARHILRTWEQRGWLSSHAQLMADWVSEFLIADALTHKTAIRRELAPGLAEVVSEHFAPVLDELSQGTRALLTAAMAPSPTMVNCYIPLARFVIGSRGLVRGLVNIAGRTISLLLTPAKAIARRILPPPAHHMQRYIESIVDLNEDSMKRLMYHQLLYSETRQQARS